MAPPELHFRTIDLEAHAATCIAFCRDVFVCSFGTDDRFVQDHGADGAGYLEWLRQSISEHASGHVHAWHDGAIVGQIHMRVLAGTRPLCGYVNQFYLLPELRGAGAGETLHRYAVRTLRSEGAERARLTVSPTNLRAVAYYRKHGWKDLGPRPDWEQVHLMERDLTDRDLHDQQD